MSTNSELLDVERARFLKKRSAQMADVRARMVLQDLEERSRAGVRAAVEKRYGHLPAADRQDIARRAARELLNASEERKMTKQQIRRRGRRLSEQERAVVRRVCEESVARDPDVKPSAVLKRLEEAHGITLSANGLAYTYLRPARKRRRAEAATAEQPSTPAELADLIVRSQKEPNPEDYFQEESEPGPAAGIAAPVVRVVGEWPDGSFTAESRSDGRWHLQGDMVVDADVADRISRALAGAVLKVHELRSRG